MKVCKFIRRVNWGWTFNHYRKNLWFRTIVPMLSRQSIAHFLKHPF